jgi:hypothetical protein
MLYYAAGILAFGFIFGPESLAALTWEAGSSIKACRFPFGNQGGKVGNSDTLAFEH